MKQLTEAESKAAFSAIESARRHEDTRLRKAAHAARTQILAEAEHLLVPYFKKTGLDVTAFQAAQERAQPEMRRLAEERKQQAIKESASVAARLRAAEKRWLQNRSFLRSHLKSSPDFVPPVVTAVETASMIVPSSGLEMDNFELSAVNNWAKVRGQWSSSANENLRFIFMWSNPNDTYTVINAASYVSVNGSCQLDANGGALGILPGGNSSLDLSASMTIWELWDQPPNSLLTETLQIFSQSANGGGWFSSVGAVEHFSVNTSTGDLIYYQLVLPPNAAVAFEVTFQIDAQIDNGSAQIDFSSGSFEVRCPLVEIGILS
jgi:hypothetical protein